MNRLAVSIMLLALNALVLTSAQAETDVPPEAATAVAAVERFSNALATGDLEKAGAELAADVIILESGGAERSAAEYLGGHGKHDAEFLKDTHRKLLRRTARRDGNLVWVASESEIHSHRDGKPLVIVSTETMVLHSTDAGWKIVHIHWSSRTRKQ